MMTTTQYPPASSAQHKVTTDVIVNALSDYKAQNIQCYDIIKFNFLCDYLIICSGTSKTHIHALAEQTQMMAKRQLSGLRVKLEGQAHTGWVLVDLGDIIVHIMSPTMRAYYDIDQLWKMPL